MLGTRRNPGGDAPPPHCDELHPPEALHALLPRADFVVLATPGTADTAQLIGAPELELMKDTSVLINVSRGGTSSDQYMRHTDFSLLFVGVTCMAFALAGAGTVDWDALSLALEAETIAACYSDVTPHPLVQKRQSWAEE